MSWLYWGAAFALGALGALAAQVVVDVRAQWRDRSDNHIAGDMSETREYRRQ